ncbi:MAG: zf-TFIIB domain-containing protein [Gemmatimonadota bacterium]|jgi:hypothetical protein
MYEFTHRLPHQPFRPGGRNEDAYFAREEVERRMQRARERQAALDQEEKERLRTLHHDRCPECGSPLERVRMAEGEVRQCATCLGVFMEHDLFARLTHPESEERGYLANLLSGLLLDFTLGSVPHEKRSTHPRQEGSGGKVDEEE